MKGKLHTFRDVLGRNFDYLEEDNLSVFATLSSSRVESNFVGYKLAVEIEFASILS